MTCEHLLTNRPSQINLRLHFSLYNQILISLRWENKIDSKLSVKKFQRKEWKETREALYRWTNNNSNHRKYTHHVACRTVAVFWHCPGSPGRIAWPAGTSVPREPARFSRTSSPASAATTSDTTRIAPSFVPFSATSFRSLVREEEISLFTQQERRVGERDDVLSRRHDASAFTGDISSRVPEMNPSVWARHERPVARCSLRRGRSESRAMNFVILWSILDLDRRSATTVVLFLSRSVSEYTRKHILFFLRIFVLILVLDVIKSGHI